MADMLYQGTVLGPPMWNLFFANARLAIVTAGFSELIFADDLNAFRVLERDCSDAAAFALIRHCQQQLHAWGAANRVTFDAGKESAHIPSHVGGEGLVQDTWSVLRSSAAHARSRAQLRRGLWLEASNAGAYESISHFGGTDTPA
eukprot:8859842-Alexandrium_andersonii.AAC.1